MNRKKKIIKINYPNFEKYKENLEKLYYLDFTGFNYDEIYNMYYDLALTLPSLGGFLVRKEFKDNKLFRVRNAKTFNEFEDKSLIQTFSYPPPSFCNYNGRANIKHKSVFYSTDNPFAAIKETNMEMNEEGYMSVWEFNAKRDLKYITYLPEILPRSNYWSKIGEYHHNLLIEEQKLINPKLLDYKILLRQLLTDKFMNENPPYNLTSLLANEDLYFENADLIIYPSRKTLSDYINYAFHPNVVNEHLKLKKILHFRLVGYNENNTQLGIKFVGDLKNDKIIWRLPNENDKLIFS